MNGPTVQTIITSTLLMYQRSAVQTSRALMKNWIIIPASVAAFYAFVISINLLGPLGFAGGFIIGLLKIGVLTLYYRWIIESADNQKMKIQDLVVFDSSLFFSIISVGFILFLVQYLVSSLTLNLELQWVIQLLTFGLVILFNPIPEVIMHHRMDGLAGLGHAYHFVLENWIEWFLPFIVLLIPALLANPGMPLVLLSTTDPLLPVLPLLTAAQYLGYSLGMPSPVLTIFAIVLASWFMVFRLDLFRALDGSSRRQRAFRAR